MHLRLLLSIVIHQMLEHYSCVASSFISCLMVVVDHQHWTWQSSAVRFCVHGMLRAKHMSVHMQLDMPHIHAVCAHAHAHCTLHAAHCTLHIAHCTLHIAHCTLHIAHCTMHLHTRMPTCLHAYRPACCFHYH